MSIFLRDPNEIRLPPDKVRLIEVRVTPAMNSSQLKIYLELTPFIKRPNIEATIISSSGREVGHASILETMLPKLEFTMHLRQVKPGDELTLETTVYYQKLPEPTDTPKELPLPEPMVVDHNTTTFNLRQEET